MARHRRSIIREPEFEEQLQRLIPSAEEADDSTLGAECVLSIDPLVGSQASESVWVLPMFPVRGSEVNLYYSFDDLNVYFLGIIAA
jgi:hypothetical protein